MTDQGWKDWEDYNTGLQGICTGSAYNQMGRQDRKDPFKSMRTAHRPQINKRKKSRKHKDRTLPKKNNDSLRVVFFFIGLIASVLFMSEAGVNEPAVYLIGGAIGGIICAAAHKIIIVASLAAIAMGILSNL